MRRNCYGGYGSDTTEERLPVSSTQIASSWSLPGRSNGASKNLDLRELTAESPRATTEIPQSYCHRAEPGFRHASEPRAKAPLFRCRDLFRRAVQQCPG